MIDFDEIRKEVAIKHGVLLNNDDPVLVTVTINEMVLQSYLQLASERYAAADRELTISLQQQVEQAKETAGRIITEAAGYVASEVRREVEAAVRDGAKILREQNRTTVERYVAAELGHAKAAQRATTMGAIMAVAAVALIVVAVVAAKLL